jgi:hypothetical protein
MREATFHRTDPPLVVAGRLTDAATPDIGRQ